MLEENEDQEYAKLPEIPEIIKRKKKLVKDLVRGRFLFLFLFLEKFFVSLLRLLFRLLRELCLFILLSNWKRNLDSEKDDCD